MDWTNNIIKAEHSSYELLFLRTILAEHGDIVTFLPCKDTRQCFVRYSTSQGAESAYNNQNSVQGLRVSTVSQDPTLLNQYLTWHSSRFVEDYSKKWCVPKQEQKAPSGPKKRAYSEVETQKKRGFHARNQANQEGGNSSTQKCSRSESCFHAHD